MTLNKQQHINYNKQTDREREALQTQADGVSADTLPLAEPI